MSTQDQEQKNGAGDSNIMMMIHSQSNQNPGMNMTQMTQGAGATQSTQVTSEVESPPQSGSNSKKRAGRRKINIEFIQDKSRRHITFSKRKAGIMKKAYELSTLTGTQVLLLVASETGHVYTFATPKLQPLITQTEGKNLIQQCLNAPEASQQQMMGGGDEDEDEEGDEDEYQGMMGNPQMMGNPGMMGNPQGMGNPQMMGQHGGQPMMNQQNQHMAGGMPQAQHMGQGAQQVPQNQNQNQYYNQQSQAQQSNMPPQQRMMNQQANSNNGMGHFQVPMNNQSQVNGQNGKTNGKITPVNNEPALQNGAAVKYTASEISSFQSLSAQLWRSVTRARKLDGSKTTTFRMAVNCRHRLEPKMEPLYFGNAIQSIPTVASVNELLTNDLNWSANLLHQNVVAHDDATVRRGVKDWESNPRLFPLGNFDGAMITMGSSPRFPMYDNDFGWGRPVAVRSGMANKFDGKISAFPGREGNGTVDLEVVLAPETMAGLEEDMEFVQYVSY